ncbi:MAG TPA: glutamine amidotransferase [Gammaproteobacteria bacterium]|jgi:GMP synthase (glutamine-hydrolysing)|nr:glutamine amidotransferase [Gammaproteobacteria bacterium]
MKQLIAIQHVGFEDLGSYQQVFEDNHFQIRYLHAGLDDLAEIDPLAADLVVVLGGPIGAYDVADYPFLNGELAWIQARLEAQKPILGFCLGAQLIARALGAKVYPGPVTEIGWLPLQLTEAGKGSPVRHLDGALTHMLHWHGDTFDLPAGATLLASTETCRHQAFSIGEHCLAFQCHPEVDATRIEAWLVGHACELAKHGIDVPALRQQSAAFGPALTAQGRRCIEDWLKAVPW